MKPTTLQFLGNKSTMWDSYGFKSNEGLQETYDFDNGYRASIVKHTFSYGGNDGLWELAIIDIKSGELVYDTHITDDVIGYLTRADFMELLEKIKSLPHR